MSCPDDCQCCQTDNECQDNNVCNGPEMCDFMLGCLSSTPIGCDNDDVCDGIETCDPVLGCQYGTPLVCGDDNPCNGVDSCHYQNGCETAPPDPGLCQDDDKCNGQEICNANDPDAGCKPGQPLACDDNDICNGSETCEPAMGCVGGTPMPCDDDVFCNGPEGCDAQTGCEPGTPLTCDDALDCTTDFCDDVADECKHEAIQGKCPCVASGLPKTHDWSLAFDDTQEANCPGFGGMIGSSLKLGLSGSWQVPDCTNNCAGSFAAQAGIGDNSIGGEVCGDAFEIMLGLKASGAFKHCVECDTKTCQQTCGDPACSTLKGSVGFKFKLTKWKGWQTGYNARIFRLKLTCGAQIGGYWGGNVDTSGTSEDDAYDCDDCQECMSVGFGLLGGLVGSAGCALTVKLKPFKPVSFGWPDVGNFDIGMFAGVAGEFGPECPPGIPLCGYVGAKVAVAVQTPKVKVKIGWFGVALQCKFGFTGCAEGTNCPQCSSNCSSCASFSPQYSCTVSN
jgi:hypothetical protein